MLAKLKLLRQEDKALEEIDSRLRAQLNRLKQEERVLRRLMRDPQGQEVTSLQESTGSLTRESEKKVGVDDGKLMNKEPLLDLNAEATSILKMCQAQYQHEQDMASEEEEEEDDEEENEEECAGGMSEGNYKKNDANEEGEGEVKLEYNKELTDLLLQMRSEVYHMETGEDENNSDYDDS